MKKSVLLSFFFESFLLALFAKARGRVGEAVSLCAFVLYTLFKLYHCPHSLIVCNSGGRRPFEIEDFNGREH